MSLFVSAMVAELFEERALLHLSDEVLFGDSVFLLEDLGAVLRVRTREGLVGYSRADSFCEGQTSPSAFRVAYRADVLKEPNITAPKSFILPRFSRVAVEGREGEFWRVTLPDGTSGYVHLHHLLPPPDKAATAEEVVSTALSLLGVPYRYGGRSAVALDCSGLVSLSFGFCGITLPRNTGDLHSLPEVEPRLCRRGDLVLFDSHVGIALTRTTFLHASASTGFVAVSSLQKSHPLFDSVHVPHGYTVRRVIV